MEFESGFVYKALHIPSNEEWYILGIDVKGDRVCAAGYPPTIANLSDCTNFMKVNRIDDIELQYRTKQFGINWI